MKVLANDGISPSGEAALKEAGFTVITDKVEQSDLIDYINKEDVAALLVRSATTVRKDLIDACPNLKLIGRGGVGMDNIDVAYAREKGKVVVNTPAASSLSVAEIVVGKMFSLARFLYDSHLYMPQNGVADFKVLKKKYGKGTELRGKTLGIIGMGRIGQALASYALGLGMKVLYNDRSSNSVDIKLHIHGAGDLTVTLDKCDKETLIKESDFISLHVPKQENGEAVLGTAELAKMKNTAFIINSARGGSVDEEALLKALDAGEIAGAALDVYENEPTPNEALLKHPKIAATPHIGAATVEAQDRIGTELADLIKEHLLVKA
ncbi:D-2-hydroxyacid dehydrogenase [Luteibaculum oceani]|uniref:3-phosphoglycerate dehydrogenase n=1 Tax=Luteibaculum oceani TaxID=1294296 RepID=A0A5C6UUK4_9FLAO|nr:D-2-hydroxyacid dehydrogenase [Luteibaculum oceani]TXC77007.1 3-phosphoglycerate dehydrogenase [Luteibaculum oceani]